MKNKKNIQILSIIGILLLLMAFFIYLSGRPSYHGIDGEKTSQTKIDALSLPQLSAKVADNEAEVEIQTTAGNIKVKLFPELAPLAVENFLALAKADYYKDNEFFRVIKSFMIQTGDPENLGTSSKSVVNDNQAFTTEISNQLYHIRGALSLANTGQESSSSSQFFIIQNKEDMSSAIGNQLYPEKIKEALKNGGYPELDGSYTVFGQVIEGMEVVDKIATAEVEANESGEESKPVKAFSIKTVKIIKDWDFK
ncbi:MAG: peptidylprolyl isomerase [Lactovum sp.]